jgi:hypothetical protein
LPGKPAATINVARGTFGARQTRHSRRSLRVRAGCAAPGAGEADVTNPPRRKAMTTTKIIDGSRLNA